MKQRRWMATQMLPMYSPINPHYFSDLLKQYGGDYLTFEFDDKTQNLVVCVIKEVDIDKKD